MKVDPLKQLPKFKGQERNFVKLTAISESRKKKSAVTYIYEVNEPFDINLAMLDIVYETYNAPKRGQKGYLKRVRAGNITQFIVDFETSV